jgi:glutaredoxin-like protein
MSMVKEKDRQALRQELKQLSQPVRLVLFTSNRNCEYCRETRDLLEEVAGLSDNLSVETYDLERDATKAAQFQIDKAPGFAVVNGKDYGIRYYGIPSGYEFRSLLDDLLAVSRGDSGLQAATKAALAKVTSPVHLQVFVTPTCPYCPRAVQLAHRMAMENELIRADMVEATEFPDLSDRYNVMGVPRIIINEVHFFEGSMPEAQFVAAALLAADPSTPAGNVLEHAQRSRA